ncbi:MAG TPA: hypothetical protein VGN96_03950 [Roseococcus sp.]|jgi:hypothetical protein|nr:hypothetical protein [Roseococcus sp.]
MSIADFVEQTTTTTGTGTLNLDGVVPLSRTFIQGFGNGGVATFIIETEAGDIEMSVGVVSAGTPDTLARTLIWSTTGSLLNLPAGTKRVYVAATADIIRFNRTIPTATGTANAPVIAHVPPVRALRTGQVFRFLVATTNTGAATLEVDGTGAQTLARPGGGSLIAGDLTAGHIVTVQWIGAQFRMVSGAPVPLFPSSATVLPVVVPELANFTLPAGGQWKYNVTVYAGGAAVDALAGQQPGGTLIATTSAGFGILGSVERVA